MLTVAEIKEKTGLQESFIRKCAKELPQTQAQRGAKNALLFSPDSVFVFSEIKNLKDSGLNMAQIIKNFNDEGLAIKPILEPTSIIEGQELIELRLKYEHAQKELADIKVSKDKIIQKLEDDKEYLQKTNQQNLALLSAPKEKDDQVSQEMKALLEAIKPTPRKKILGLF
jgi:DNA-binding transcriptional MerR regulator